MTADTLFAGHDNMVLYLECDHLGDNKNLTSVMFHLSERFAEAPQPVTIKMSNKLLYAYFRDKRGLRMPVEDGELHININIDKKTYEGHFKNLVFGLYENTDDRVTISGEFNMEGHTPVASNANALPQKNYSRDFS